MRGKDLIAATLFGGAGGSSGGGSGGGWPDVPDDGATYLYITLTEGRTSPMLGVCVQGTMTIDWGDGSDPETKTGTNLNASVHTSNHAYAKPGDYVIRLTVDGGMGFRGDSASPIGSAILRKNAKSDYSNVIYQSALRGVKMGDGVSKINENAFRDCYGLEFVVFPENMKTVGNNTFYCCPRLSSVDLPAQLSEISNYMFRTCYNIKAVTIPKSVEKINDFAFYSCYNISSITIPGSVNYIGSGAFYYCYGMAYYDFTACTAVPTLANTNAFTGITDDCEIRVPAALYDEWVAATNWATYADYIKAY